MSLKSLYANNWMKHAYQNNDMRFKIRETYVTLNDHIKATRQSLLGRGEKRQARIIRHKNRTKYVNNLNWEIRKAIR